MALATYTKYSNLAARSRIPELNSAFFGTGSHKTVSRIDLYNI